MKKERGITLIALVVTIIVLIILAGISINLLFEKQGIILKAKQGKIDMQQAKVNEEEVLNDVSKYIENEINESEIVEIPINSFLKAGEYIKYDTGVSDVGKNGIIMCRVLYDTNSEYGIQIISDNKIKDSTLGGNDWDTSSNIYNNVIQILNSEAEKYINNKYVTDARCIGSNPTIKNEIFINKNLENVGPVKLEFTSAISSANNMKEEDTNYIIDQKQINDLKINIAPNCWLASRWVDRRNSSSYCGFGVRHIDAYGSAKGATGLCGISAKRI